MEQNIKKRVKKEVRERDNMREIEKKIDCILFLIKEKIKIK